MDPHKVLCSVRSWIQLVVAAGAAAAPTEQTMPPSVPVRLLFLSGAPGHHRPC